MKVTIGNVVIADNAGNQDLDPAVDVIRFDSAATPGGFALPPNCSATGIKGEVRLGVVGTVVQFLPAAAGALVLTKLVARTAANAGNQQLTITFEHDFAGPAAPVDVGEQLSGRFVDMAGASLAGSSVQWSAFVNGRRITPPNVPFNLLIPANAPVNVPVAPPVGGPMRVAAGGPPWTLRGEVIVQLAGPNHRLELPDSAEIAIAPVVFRDPGQQVSA